MLQGIVVPKPGDTSPYDIDAIGVFNLTVCRSLNPLTEEGDKCGPGNALCVKTIKGGYIVSNFICDREQCYLSALYGCVEKECSFLLAYHLWIDAISYDTLY